MLRPNYYQKRIICYVKLNNNKKCREIGTIPMFQMILFYILQLIEKSNSKKKTERLYCTVYTARTGRVLHAIHSTVQNS